MSLVFDFAIIELLPRGKCHTLLNVAIDARELYTTSTAIGKCRLDNVAYPGIFGKFVEIVGFKCDVDES